MSIRPLVIAAVDASPETERTVEYAVGLARARGATLHVVQVVAREGTLWTAPERELALRARLRTLRTWAQSEGVPVRIVALRGKPESAIPAYAQLAGARLIVVGSHYGTSRLWGGIGVASRRLAPVPVVVVPRGVEGSATVSPKRIVAAVDFTVASAVALRTAVGLVQRHGASLTVLHAMDAPLPTVFSGSEAWNLVEWLPIAEKPLAERLRRRAIASGAGDAQRVVVTGNPHHGIVDTATRTNADLIVMGVAPRTWIDEVLSRSTLRAVLRRTKTPVLVVPVVAGAHGWIDEIQQDVTVGTPSGAEAIERHAA